MYPQIYRTPPFGAPQKIHPKISRIIKGFPLRQYLGDFQIWSDRVANVGGRLQKYLEKLTPLNKPRGASPGREYEDGISTNNLVLNIL